MLHLLMNLTLLYQAQAAPIVTCTDVEQSVEVIATLVDSKPGARLASLQMKSGGKAKMIDSKSISRFLRDANAFYILFKVTAKAGVQELELNTRFNKGQRGTLISSGYLTNKSQGHERVKIDCRF